MDFVVVAESGRRKMELEGSKMTGYRNAKHGDENAVAKVFLPKLSGI